MFPNWLGVFSAVLAIVAFQFFATREQATGKHVRLRWMLALVIISLPGASFAAYYAHVLPEPAWYYEFRSWTGTELLLVPIGAAGGVAATFLPPRRQRLSLLLVAAFVVAPVFKPFIGPLSSDAFTNVWSDGVCLQSTASTCGAASLATILRTHGIEATEQQLAAEAHSYLGGTEAWYLARSARSRGMTVSFAKDVEIADMTPPVVAGVKLRSQGHFIPILERSGEEFVSGDPLLGREVLTRQELMARYEFTGFCMFVAAEP